MENVISARRLRKSVLNENKNANIEMYDLDKGYRKSDVRKESKININFKNKIIIKFCVCSIILFLAITCKMFFKQQLKDIPKLVRFYEHYKMDFTKDVILDKFEFQVNKLVITTGNIVPEKIRMVINGGYNDKIKPFILDFNLQDTVISVFNPIEKNAPVEIYEPLNGMGGAEPIANNIIKPEKEEEFENKFEEAISAISIMDTDVETIISKNIDMISPIKGVITSRFGAREEIFNNVDPYHTGTDIAAKKGSKILSSTKGKVTKVEYGNKYYGNYAEVTIEGVIFKYAHMDTINVKINDEINQEHIIGTVGSTGMSTGPHLHFEVKIEGRVVDPEYLVKL